MAAAEERTHHAVRYVSGYEKIAYPAPGELVTWDLGGHVPHIGRVVDQCSPSSGGYMIVHNGGQGPKMEDVLFAGKITGYYR
ncbi:MAG: DUF1287 domain-containing protein [Candidatus Solibacter sp.]